MEKHADIAIIIAIAKYTDIGVGIDLDVDRDINTDSHTDLGL